MKPPRVPDLQMLKILRCMTLAAVVALLFLMLGPFQRLEQDTGVSDKFAHVVAFAIITVALLLNIPRLSRLAVAGVAFSLAILVEVAQSFVGRDAEIGDILAGGLGVLLVTAVWVRRPLV